jgi:hypothetical protein
MDSGYMSGMLDTKTHSTHGMLLKATVYRLNILLGLR